MPDSPSRPAPRPAPALVQRERRARDALTAQIVGHGRSNITYRVDAGENSWVVRRPPLSHVQATAHDMGREFRILTALAPDRLPGAEALRALQRHRDHRLAVLRDGVRRRLHRHRPDRGREALRRGRPQAHRRGADRRPGPAPFVRPGRDRPLRLRQAAGVPRAAGAPLLASSWRRSATARRRSWTSWRSDWRRRCRPRAQPGIVHGDYRLDNAILDDEGHLIAVLDWEMCTLGDSLADLGLLRMYWGQGTSRNLLTIGVPVMQLPGFPTLGGGRRALRGEERRRPLEPRLLHRPRALQARRHPGEHVQALPRRRHRRRRLRDDRPAGPGPREARPRSRGRQRDPRAAGLGYRGV